MFQKRLLRNCTDKWRMKQKYQNKDIRISPENSTTQRRKKYRKKSTCAWNCWFFENCRQNTLASTETSQKINYDVVLHYISIPICPLLFPKFWPIQKNKKTLKNCRYLVKTALAVYLFFYKRIFFETLVIFLESTIKLITRIFDLQK